MKDKRKSVGPTKEAEEEFFLAQEMPVDRRKTVQPKSQSKEEKKLAKENEKNKKAFSSVKKMNNQDVQSKEFGNFIDQRVSNPITISNRLTVNITDATKGAP